MKNEKQWSILLLALVLATLVLVAAVTAVIDPFFHYHAPLDRLEYPLDNQRYQNDGITRHFDYDAMIIGTSMTENFLTSEYDALFGVHSIKVNYSGASFPELFDALERAIDRNPELKHVIFAIDQWFLLEGWDMLAASGDYPTYLYDENLANDVNYLLNKSVLFENTLGVLDYTRYGYTTPTFDEYSNWNDLYTFDAGLVLQNYDRPALCEVQPPLTEGQKEALAQMLRGTIVRLAREHPDIEFVCFYPPYSVLAWDRYIRQGTLEQQLEAYALASEVLLEGENIQLYSFLNDFQLVSDLNHYKDFSHHSQEINSLLLQRFANKEYLLTRETNASHWEEVGEYYRNFDYEGLLGSVG